MKKWIYKVLVVSSILFCIDGVYHIIMRILFGRTDWNNSLATYSENNIIKGILSVLYTLVDGFSLSFHRIFVGLCILLVAKNINVIRTYFKK